MLKPVSRLRSVEKPDPQTSAKCVRGFRACIRRRSQTEDGGVRLDMNVRTAKKPDLAGGACFALCLLVLTASSGWAATTPIYKCFDKNLGLLYTDEPCKDGEQLNIRAGDADSAAVARLERQRDALDQSAAQRMADQRRAAAEGNGASRLRYEPVEDRESSDYGPAYDSDYGFVSYPVMHHHPVRPRHPKPHHMRHVAPPPPYVVPRG
jgi:hypothetical protein